MRPCTVTWSRDRVVVAVTTLLLVTTAVTYVQSSRAMAQVSAVPDEVQCSRDGADEAELPPLVRDVLGVPGEEDDTESDAPEPGFQVVDDGRQVECVLRLFVRNDGARAVTLRSLEVASWGSEGGGTFRADDLGGSTTGTRDKAGDDGIASAAAWDVEEKLAPGEFTRVEVGFVSRGEICRDGPYVASITPTMKLSSLAWGSTVSTRVAIASLGVEPMGCVRD